MVTMRVYGCLASMANSCLADPFLRQYHDDIDDPTAIHRLRGGAGSEGGMTRML